VGLTTASACNFGDLRGDCWDPDPNYKLYKVTCEGNVLVETWGRGSAECMSSVSRTYCADHAAYCVVTGEASGFCAQWCLSDSDCESTDYCDSSRPIWNGMNRCQPGHAAGATCGMDGKPCARGLRCKPEVAHFDAGAGDAASNVGVDVEVDARAAADADVQPDAADALRDASADAGTETVQRWSCQRE
jgi:hypothetical protein